jgi:kumamolisin
LTPTIPLPGSKRAFLPGTWVVGPARRDEVVSATLVLSGKQPTRGQRIGRSEWLQRHVGPCAVQNAAVYRFARTHGLPASSLSLGRTIKLTGAVWEMEKAFGCDLLHCEHPHGSYRGRQGHVLLPAELHGVVTAVLGLDDRPIARPYFRKETAKIRFARQAALINGLGWSVAKAKMTMGGFSIPQLCSLYNFPKVTAGPQQAIGLIELGGGYKPADIAAFFSSINLPAPQVVPVSVDGGKNSPGSDADGEVMLDILVAAAAYTYSTGKPAKIVVYFAPNSDAGFLNAVNAAVHDSTNKPSTVSISWGGPEDAWTAQAMQAMDSAFAAGVALGVTITAAAGDAGASDGENTNQADFPSSSPHVLACGGTTLTAQNGRITSEVVWNGGAQGGATGGGVSAVFSLPSYQQGLTGLTTRGVPDVAAVADPATGYQVRVDGQDQVIGGTSAVAPLWAALLAVCNQALEAQLKPAVGDVHAALYALPPGVLHDITSGNNAGFAAGPGWDACTGLGTPDGSALLAALAGPSSPPPAPTPVPTPTPTPTPAPAAAQITLSQSLAAGVYSVAPFPGAHAAELQEHKLTAGQILVLIGGILSQVGGQIGTTTTGSGGTTTKPTQGGGLGGILSGIGGVLAGAGK